ncbi:MAG: four-helix bundle copper-binding protein [Gammaproteobacteria bacterium]|nr:four-helix bundle copper-binding protein [Gammaproteobacteria bacterium]
MSKEKYPTHSSTNGISRRDLLISTGAVASVLASGMTFAGDKPGHRHENHAPRHPKLLDAVNACVDKGQRCIAHCLVAFQEGDTTLADCASKVHEMDAICTAYSYLLSANSTYAKDFAKICKQVCTDCEKECRKHDKQHTECRECADACEHVVATLNKVFA